MAADREDVFGKEGHAPPATDFAGLFLASPSPFLVLAPDAPRFTIIEVNDAYLRATMTDRDALIGRGMFDAFPDNPADAGATGVKTLRASLERVLATRRPDAMAVQKYDIRRPDGSFEERHWSPVNSPVLEETGKMTAIIHHVEDVSDYVLMRSRGAEQERETERLEAEIVAAAQRLQRTNDELRESEERFRLMADSAPAHVWTTDDQGKLTFANRWYLETFGRSPDELLGEGWRGTVHPEDADALWGAFAEAFAARRLLSAEARVIDRNGRVRWLSSQGAPRFSESGRFLGYTGVNLDITDRKQAEGALREQSRNLEILNRIGAAVAAELDLQRLVQMVTDAGVELTGAEFGAFFYNVLNETGESYTLYTLSGVDRSAFDKFPMPRNTAVFGPTFRGEGVVRSDDIMKDPRYGHNEPYRGMPEGHLPVRSYLAVPVISRSGEVLGGLFFGHSETGRFTDRHERLMTGIAAQAAIGIDNARLFQSAQREIEERRRAEEALRESEARFRELADNISQFAWTADGEGNRYWYNRRWYDFTGATPEEMEGQGWRKAHHPDSVDEMVEKLANAFRAGEPWEETFRLRGKDGDYRWFLTRAVPIRDEDGHVLRWFGTNTDVTELRAAEQALRETTRRLDAVLDNTRMAVFLMNDRRQCIYANAAAEQLTGYDFAEMQDRRMHDLLHDKHPDGNPYPIEDCPIDRAFPEGHQIRGEEIFVHKNGNFYPVAFTASPVRDDHGRPIGTVVEARDITEEQAAAEELLQLNETLERRIAEAIAEREQAEDALRQAQKMEAVGQLTGGIAHDFNNLLTVVIGNIDMGRRALEAANGDTRTRRALENAARGAERAAALTQRLLAFARRQPLSPRPLEIGKLLAGMSDLLGRSLGETIDLDIVAAPGLWQVEADPNQLEAAILNLAVNARDAMPDGGDLMIETVNTHVDHGHAAAHTEIVPGQYVVIAVTDNGRGMPKDVVGRVFEPFFTTKEVGKGTGLGLSQVYGFVKQSGGHVNLHSEEGHGTTVKIYLPRLTGGSEDGEEEGLCAIEVSPAAETLLVVEDDDDVRAYTVELLREIGYRVLEAHDGPSALGLLERQEKPVDLLFTDVVMPGMSGRELADKARELWPGLKILYTSGYTRDAIVHGGRLDPGVDLIGKPFTYLTLGRKIRDLLDERD